MWQVILYISPLSVAAFLTATVGLCLLGVWWRSRADARRLLTVARFLLVGWGLVVFVATVLPMEAPGSGSHEVAWVPGEGLWEPSGYQGAGAFAEERENVLRLQVANTAMFIPLAALSSLAFPALSGIAVIGCCLALSASIETAQFLLAAGRTADVDDLLFNTLGGVIGTFSAHLATQANRLRPGSGRHRA
ncbi:VanZ family protein [Streptomyces sp. 796.1]|uniref:VanZ family protein n=1 Tax=Streptomyces sp. 796.1 TaxID=3163029 RepID=UPI0039C91957